MSNPDQLISVLTMVAVFLIILIFTLIGVWFFIVAKQKKNDGEKSEKNEATPSPNATYNLQSIMDFMEFEKVEDNMIIQKKGKYLMVLECQGINYDLMSEMEMASVEQGFIEFLNTLKFDIQIYVQTRTVNLESSLREYKLKFRDIEDKYNMLWAPAGTETTSLRPAAMTAAASNSPSVMIHSGVSRMLSTL